MFWLLSSDFNVLILSAFPVVFVSPGHVGETMEGVPPPPRAAKGIVTASAAGAHLIDERCGAISFVSDLLV